MRFPSAVTIIMTIAILLALNTVQACDCGMFNPVSCGPPCVRGDPNDLYTLCFLRRKQCVDNVLKSRYACQIKCAAS
ncbi:hypothetical protein BKA57DRAFT_467207 [Linnemannia elongata]|nr:hypothetical protein BKA57DRAFT_467207 [Linnemannia elongata]